MIDERIPITLKAEDDVIALFFSSIDRIFQVPLQ